MDKAADLRICHRRKNTSGSMFSYRGGLSKNYHAVQISP
jgi:hypothetical protein